MAATSTLRQILIEVTERYGLGQVVAGLTSGGSGTTFTLTTAGTPELQGRFSAKKFPVGSPVVVLTETTGTSGLGDRTFVSNWNPSTGVLTVSPAVASETDLTEIIVFNPEIGDADRVIEAVNRAVQYRIGRWELRPLTFVPDGDMQGTTVGDYWTAAANGTAAYASAQVYPAGSAADAVGQVAVNRVLQLTTSGGSSSVDSNGIRVPPNTQVTGYQWYFLTAIRLVSGTGTVTLSVRDNTNSAAITTNLIRGSADNTLAIDVAGDFLICEGTFNLPADCGEIAFRLSCSADTMVVQMTPLIAFPTTAYAFPLPNRIDSAESVGNFYCANVVNGPSGLPDLTFMPDPRPSRLIDYGDHLTVSFNERHVRATWYEEYVNGSALSAMTDTTTFPVDRIAKWAYFELTDRLMRQEMTARMRTEGGTPIPSVWRPIRNAALKEAGWSGYEPEMKNLVGRRA